MTGGYLKSASRLALIAAAGIFAHSAQAADLGGNCCADLEERVAELEATSARKGNRKVSLTVYGQINEQVTYWNDGGEKNIYVNEGDDDKNRIGFRGTAKINSDWTAGFKLEYEAKVANSSDLNQVASGDNGGTTSSVANTRSLSLRHAYWQLGSATYGTVSVGWQGVAAGGVASINLAEPGGFATNDPAAWANSFFLRAKNGAPGNAGLSMGGGSGALTWNSIDARWGSGANGSGMTRRNSVKYSSPLFLGLSKSSGLRFETSWGEDDYWDAALKYVEDFGTFRFAAGVAYTQLSDMDSSGCASAGNDPLVTAHDCNVVTAGASLMHTPTGLYVTGTWAKATQDSLRGAYRGSATTAARQLEARGLVDTTEEWWYVQVGWEAKLNALGKTTFWGDYHNSSTGSGIQSSGYTISTMNAADVLNSLGATAVIQSANLKTWGLGITQDIDAAAMKLFIGYKRIEGDFKIFANNTLANARPIEDLQIVYTGATIQF